jgi:phospholipid-binding lipoprotein MlaA
MMKLIILLPFSVLLLSLTACSISPEKTTPTEDKWEKLNRKTFAFNEAMDKRLVKPVVKGYQAITPDIAEKGVHNFFSNLGDISNAFNNLLQLKVGEAGNDLTRFAFNTTFGIGGLIDVASELKMEKHDEDFGQTLASWGVAPGPYLVLPVFGPSSLRDAGGRIADYALDPVSYVDDMDALPALKLVDTRADLMSTEIALDSLPGDRYEIMRDTWVKNRAYLISDGENVEQAVERSSLEAELEALD